jgi:hypothetical protein
MVSFGEGQAIFLPALTVPASRDLDPRVWKMPENADELESAVVAVSSKPLLLRVDAPEWVGVSHDRQKERDVIHLFNYRDQPVTGIVLHFRGAVRNGWAVSPQRKEREDLALQKQGAETLLQLPRMEAYEIVVLEH